MSVQEHPEMTHWQYAAYDNPYMHFCFWGGVATGKTFVGSHFAIKQVSENPEATGFIGANSYDQLSQVALREFFYWLDFYGYQYVSDKRPPRSWGEVIKLKTYHNTVCVRAGTRVALIFTRVLGEGNPLRGLEFTWYWIDETRDTPKDTYNVIASRLREGENIKGLITSTTNGDDWVKEQFIGKGEPGFGYMHVPTIRSLEAGIITVPYYKQLLSIYSKQEAKQELDALHVNITGNPVYHSYDANIHQTDINPFLRRDEKHLVLSPYLPIIVALDFNLSPMSWTLGQNSGRDFYWYDEIHLNHSHTQEAAQELVGRISGHAPGIILAGDATSKAGQRAAAGQSDYDILGQILNSAGIRWTNRTPESNPKIRDRVNTVNTLLMAADNSVHMWHHSRCQYLRRDLEQVGWKEGALYVLDPGANNDLTHASDGIGYGVCALAPIPRATKPGTLAVIRR